MSGYTPLIVFLLILFIVGGALPLFVAPFVDTTIYDDQSFVAPLISFMESNISLVGFIQLNPIRWLPLNAQNFIFSQMNCFSYIPNSLSVPLVIIMLSSLIWVIVSFIPTIPG